MDLTGSTPESVQPASREHAIMLHRLYQLSRDQSLTVIPFPVDAARNLRGQHPVNTSARQGAVVTFMDRRIDVLARELGCLGHYEMDPNEPDAA